ncbi:MAG: pyridoxal phosphate-dependent aminotransferase [Calditrichia bacterium]
MKIASRINRIEGSKTLQVKEKALEMRARGYDVVDVTAGEPDFDTPQAIRQAAIEAINGGFTRYTAITGIPELRKLIAQKLKTENGLDYTPEQIIVSNGAKQSILNTLFAIVEEGDEVLIPVPYWVSYPEQVKMTGAKPVLIDTMKTGFKLTPEVLSQHITGSTRVIILNSPSNPTGVVYTKEELTALAQILKDKDIWVISDEIYEKLIYDGLEHTSIATLEGMYEKTIVINGFSKSHAMTGWRLGYAAAPLPLVKAMSKIQGHSTSNASSISQKAGVAALGNLEGEIEKMRQTFEERRNYIKGILDGFKHLDYVNPQGAFYFFIDVSKVFGCRCGAEVIDNSIKFSTYLTENYYLVTVPGAVFGADNYIRMSFAASREVLEKAMDRLTRAVKEMLEQK